jgi:hypothetical protein
MANTIDSHEINFDVDYFLINTCENNFLFTLINDSFDLFYQDRLLMFLSPPIDENPLLN